MKNREARGAKRVRRNPFQETKSGLPGGTLRRIFAADNIDFPLQNCRCGRIHNASRQRRACGSGVVVQSGSKRLPRTFLRRYRTLGTGTVGHKQTCLLDHECDVGSVGDASARGRYLDLIRARGGSRCPGRLYAA